MKNFCHFTLVYIRPTFYVFDQILAECLPLHTQVLQSKHGGFSFHGHVYIMIGYRGLGDKLATEED